MENDPGKALEFLKLLQATQNIDPNDMLPSLSSRELKSAIKNDNNKGKLIIALFIESSNPAINLFHKQLSPIPKKTRMALGYCIDINESVASDFNLRKAITTILFKDGKELKRFEGMIGKEEITAIEEITPADPFAGGSHRITDMDKVDTEEYWKSVRRTAPPPPQNQSPKKIKKVSKFDDFISKNNIVLQEPQNTQPQSIEPTIPFLNPFEKDYDNLVEELQNVSYETEDIASAIIAGCTEMNEASEFIENMNNKVPNDKPLSLPGFNIDNLTPKQKEAYEECMCMLDPVKVLYIILYTGADDMDTIMNIYEEKQNGIPFKPKDPIDLEVQRIMNNSPTNFSMTAPQTNNDDFYSSMRTAQQEVIKEAQEAKRQREAEQKYKRDTIEAIRKQREMAKKERENQFSKTTPVSTPKAVTPAKQQNSTTATIRFRLPSGKTTDYTFNTTDTFETIERKLKDENHINENDVIEFAVVPTPRVSRQDFGLQLKDKNIRGKVMMSIIILRQDPPAEQ